jgi:DNA repair ATPase RecN
MDEENYDAAARKFRSAEEALRRIIDASNELAAQGELLELAAKELQQAKKQTKETIDDAVNLLKSAEGSLTDTASSIFRLASDLKGPARDLADTAQALRNISPEKLFNDIASIKRSQKDLSDGLRALRKELTMASKERREFLESNEKSFENAVTDRLDLSNKLSSVKKWLITTCALVVFTAILVIAL